jgi:hypothetical protein
VFLDGAFAHGQCTRDVALPLALQEEAKHIRLLTGQNRKACICAKLCSALGRSLTAEANESIGHGHGPSNDCFDVS